MKSVKKKAIRLLGKYVNSSLIIVQSEIDNIHVFPFFFYLGEEDTG